MSRASRKCNKCGRLPWAYDPGRPGDYCAWSTCKDGVLVEITRTEELLLIDEQKNF